MHKNLPDSVNENNNEATIHSFVIRVWKEEVIDKKNQEIWRGHITPVLGGERLYFTNIKKIPNLILAHLKLHKNVY